MDSASYVAGASALVMAATLGAFAYRLKTHHAKVIADQLKELELARQTTVLASQRWEETFTIHSDSPRYPSNALPGGVIHITLVYDTTTGNRYFLYTQLLNGKPVNRYGSGYFRFRLPDGSIRNNPLHPGNPTVVQAALMFFKNDAVSLL